MLLQIVLLLLVILFIFLLYKILKNSILIVINSIIGIFALYGFNLIFNEDVKIGFLSVVITAVGGIIGFGLVVTFHYLGWAF